MKKINYLLIGTNNDGKLREIRSLLPKNIKTRSVKYYQLNSPPENGSSFKENSLIKSKFFSKKTNLPCLADDSGLEIDILNKKPGIFSARWGGKKGDFNKAIKKVFRELNKKDKKWREKRIVARFICALTIYGLKKKPIHSLGIVRGLISNKKMGKNGFGYDPIFIPLNKKRTFGQMKYKEKLKIDHRFKAFQKVKKFF